MNAREKEVCLWLENKLGSLEDSWSSHTITGQISRDRLVHVPRCFLDLPVHVKLRVLISFLHLSKKNLEQWSDELDDILVLAVQDADDWVQTIAELLKEYPSSAALSFNMEQADNQFARTLDELKTIVRKHARESSQLGDPASFPLDSVYLNKNALVATIGSTPTAVKHFALKRKPKSAALRAELLQKSQDAAKNVKTKGGSLSAIVPMRARNMARKMDNAAPMKGLPTVNASKTSGGFGATKTFARPVAPKKEGGIKLIEIAETPQALKKKQRGRNSVSDKKQSIDGGPVSKKSKYALDSEMDSDTPADWNEGGESLGGYHPSEHSTLTRKNSSPFYAGSYQPHPEEGSSLHPPSAISSGQRPPFNLVNDNNSRSIGPDIQNSDHLKSTFSTQNMSGNDPRADSFTNSTAGPPMLSTRPAGNALITSSSFHRQGNVVFGTPGTSVVVSSNSSDSQTFYNSSSQSHSGNDGMEGSSQLPLLTNSADVPDYMAGTAGGGLGGYFGRPSGPGENRASGLSTNTSSGNRISLTVRAADLPASVSSLVAPLPFSASDQIAATTSDTTSHIASPEQQVHRAGLIYNPGASQQLLSRQESSTSAAGSGSSGGGLVGSPSWSSPTATNNPNEGIALPNNSQTFFHQQQSNIGQAFETQQLLNGSPSSAAPIPITSPGYRSLNVVTQSVPSYVPGNASTVYSAMAGPAGNIHGRDNIGSLGGQGSPTTIILAGNNAVTSAGNQYVPQFQTQHQQAMATPMGMPVARGSVSLGALPSSGGIVPQQNQSFIQLAGGNRLLLANQQQPTGSNQHQQPSLPQQYVISSNNTLVPLIGSNSGIRDAQTQQINILNSAGQIVCTQAPGTINLPQQLLNNSTPSNFSGGGGQILVQHQPNLQAGSSQQTLSVAPNGMLTAASGGQFGINQNSPATIIVDPEPRGFGAPSSFVGSLRHSATTHASNVIGDGICSTSNLHNNTVSYSAPSTTTNLIAHHRLAEAGQETGLSNQQLMTGDQQDGSGGQAGPGGSNGERNISNINQAGVGTPASSTKIPYKLTKEIMAKAQELFRNANKLSRPEKALILGFMAGNRDNPCPEMGSQLTLRLNDVRETNLDSDGRGQQTVQVETFFQMNYDTGEWKKFSKTTQLPPGQK